jgi:mono/diheme cytochrome c family protein
MRGTPATPAPRSQCSGGARRLPDAPQGDGDADVGRRALLNGSYMSCGIPLSLWLNPLFGALVQSAFPTGGVKELPGREGDNYELPSSVVSFTSVDGAKVVNMSCLVCHAGRFDGEYIIGLGNVAADFTRGIADGSLADSLPPAVIDLLFLSRPERANLDKMLRVARSVGPYTAMRVVGNNPAEALAGVLFAHHDAETLAWSDAPVISMKVYDDAGAEIVDPILTSDPPPWWRVKKKSALFYNGMARGQHRGTEEIATLACVDSVAEARRVDAIFRDIQAFVRTVPQPRWRRAVDRQRAGRGRDLFEDHCSCCHGSYADDAGDDARDWYPNLIVPLDELGTDPVVAKIGAWAPQVKAWYDRSLYSEVTPAVVGDPFFGYVAPPLDAVWATAPYLHNGSVPSVDLVLNSKARPAQWRRVDYDDRHIDEEALGWPWQPAPRQADAPAAERKLIYDTSAWGQGNGGHTFGDALTDRERRDVIEYLKTL